MSAEEALRRASRHPLAHLVARGLDRCGVEAPTRIVIACSGGGDSVALVVLVAALWQRRDPSLDSVAVISVDHGLRADAAAECAHAVEVARWLGVQRAEVRPVAVARDGNTLDAARSARRSELARRAAEHGAVHVLLAHQADDRAEGLLLALARGAGIEAAANLLPVRGSEHGVVLCRPLLDARRDELRAFLREVGVRWIDDPSNALRSRGAMRSEPALRALIERIGASAGAFLDDAAALCALRDEIASDAIPDGVTSISRTRFDAIPEPARGSALVRLARHAGGTIARETVQRAIDAARRDRDPRTFAVQAGLTLTVDARQVAVTAD